LGEQFRYTPLDQALQTLARAIGPRSRVERVGVREAYGRVLAEDVVAVEDSPKRDTSHFDGFAVISDDTKGATRSSPVTLKLRRGASPPGRAPAKILGHGEAMEALTGGFLPVGADAVVPLEDALTEGGEVRLSRHLSA
jgi:molybdopterin molybdotransferase